MSAGHALDDDDRYPWLETIGEWLADHLDGGVMSCSALKRSYRDQLRKHCPQVRFVHLHGSPEVIERRQASRPGHFMPASLLASQFATLEPLETDEAGVELDVDRLRRRPRRRLPEPLPHRGELMHPLTTAVLAADAELPSRSRAAGSSSSPRSPASP